MPDSRPILSEVDGLTVIVVGGVIQSVEVNQLPATGSYWHTMLPDRRPSSALLLGLGGGTLAHLLTQRFGPLRIVGVDASTTMVDLGRAEFDLDALEHLEIVVADAFRFVFTCPEQFDQIFVDLFVGGEMVRGITARPFLRQLCRLLHAGGTVTFNLSHDRRSGERLHRLRTVFGVARPSIVGKNLVVSCRT